MDRSPANTTASLLVVAIGVLWGFYWVPVRRLAEAGLPGAWGSLALAAAAALFLAPAALTRARAELARADPRMLASLALGGAGFVLYSVGLLYGRVAMVTLLFYLTPVWSTLIGRYLLGWRVAPLRLWAIAVGLAGLAAMLGGGGQVPLPRNPGEWLGLLSGLLWSVSSTGIRTAPPLGALASAFVFAGGACLGALLLLLLFAAPPDPVALDLRPALGWSLGGGVLWWGLSMAGLMWATARLEPARTGILLMAEVLVGAASGALLAGEHLSAAEIAGGALVLLAGLLEVWPVPPPRGASLRRGG